MKPNSFQVASSPSHVGAANLFRPAASPVLKVPENPPPPASKHGPPDRNCPMNLPHCMLAGIYKAYPVAFDRLFVPDSERLSAFWRAQNGSEHFRSWNSSAKELCLGILSVRTNIQEYACSHAGARELCEAKSSPYRLKTYQARKLYDSWGYPAQASEQAHCSALDLTYFLFPTWKRK